MRYFLFLLTVISLHIHSLSAAYNEKHYEGNPAWEHFEGYTLMLLDKFLPPNPKVFEAGAYTGNQSASMAKFWPEGMIISFEPIPSRFKEYKEKAKSFSNMYGYNLAANVFNGDAKLYVCRGTWGADEAFESSSSLLEPSEGMKIHYLGPEITVPCVVFDDWCKTSGVSNIDLLWMELEGFELQFLRSSPNILNTVQAIVTATNFYSFRKETTQYIHLKPYLESKGFKLIAHWYREGLQGNAVFIREEVLKEKGLNF